MDKERRERVIRRLQERGYSYIDFTLDDLADVVSEMGGMEVQDNMGVKGVLWLSLPSGETQELKEEHRALTVRQLGRQLLEEDQ